MHPSSSTAGWLAPLFVGAFVFLLGPHAGDSVVPQLLQRATTAAQSGLPASAVQSLEAVLTFEPALASLHWVAADLALRGGDVPTANRHLEAAARTGHISVEPKCDRSGLQPGDTNQEEGACSREAAFLSFRADSLWTASAFDQAYPLLTELADNGRATPEELRRRALAASVYDPDRTADSVRDALSVLPRADPLLQDVASLQSPGDDGTGAAYQARLGGMLAMGGEWGLARVALEAAVAEQPNLAVARSYLGMTLERLGESGFNDLWAGVLTDPASSLTWTLLGTYWLDHGETGRALDSLRQARRLDPTNAAAVAGVGAALAARGDISGAAEAYLLAAEMEPERPDFWLLVAEFSLAHEHAISSLGLQAARNAVALAPSDMASLDVLGYMQVLTGEPRLAIRLLRAAVDVSPYDPSPYYHLGLAYLTLEDGDRAAQALRSAIRLDPQGPIAALAERVLGNLAP